MNKLVRITKKEFNAGVRVKMPKQLFDDFIYHLESGKVKQGYRSMFDGQGYCCLGLLQATATGGKVEAFTDFETKKICFHELPSMRWLDRTGIAFARRANDDHAREPVLGNGCTASICNDVKLLSFKEIAELFKQVTVTY